MTPARAVRLALARAADELFDLPLVVTGVQVSRIMQDMVPAQIDDQWLITVLDGSDGAVAVAAIDMPFLGALVECQTLGRVSSRPIEARRSTQTDAALFAPLIDSTLSGMGGALAIRGGDIQSDGFRFGARIESARMLGLLLQAAEFHLFRLDVDLGDGAKQGEMVLALPVPSRSETADASDGMQRRDTGHAGGDERVGSKEKSGLMDAEVCLDAVLWQFAMPLSEIEGLAVGDFLAFPKDALSKVQLESGRECLPGSFQLGHKGGFRAVRLNAAATDREYPSPATSENRQASETSLADAASRPEKTSQNRELAEDEAMAPKPREQVDVAATSPESASAGIENHTPDLPDLSDLPEFS